MRAVESRTLERKSRISRVNVIVEDINDHAPVFNPVEYKYVVKDSLLTGELLHKVSYNYFLLRIIFPRINPREVLMA